MELNTHHGLSCENGKLSSNQWRAMRPVRPSYWCSAFHTLLPAGMALAKGIQAALCGEYFNLNTVNLHKGVTHDTWVPSNVGAEFVYLVSPQCSVLHTFGCFIENIVKIIFYYNKLLPLWMILWIIHFCTDQSKATLSTTLSFGNYHMLYILLHHDIQAGITWTCILMR